MTENPQEVKIDYSSLFNQAIETFTALKERQEQDKLNILILGGTGVGKSTLINTVFGKEVAKTGDGAPVTQKIEKFEKEGLCIYDSKGLEKNDPSIIEDLKILLDKQKQKEVNEQIHIAWLCICEATRRVEPLEKELYGLLKQYNFPTIVVITKAMQNKNDKGEKFDEIVKNELKTAETIRTRAIETKLDDEENILKPMGVKDLINESYNRLSEAQQNALARKQNYDRDMKKAQCKKDATSKLNCYSTTAGAVAATPIPFSDIALILPTQIAMIVHISNIYNLDFDKESVKKITLALLGVCGAGFGIRLGVGAALKFLPGLGSVAGGAINATIATTATKAMGELYIKYLDNNFDDIENNKQLSFNFEDYK
ncbi:DUF697 domain-containing protein [Campylobacter jejuni]|nr:DUF697 domain-containing protein [Campylobacter jejuni]EJD3103203.1 DUF697 domain-containing protein [Campylobacter jejuni]